MSRLRVCKDCGLPSSFATGDFGGDSRCPWESYEILPETQVGWTRLVIISSDLPSRFATQLKCHTLRSFLRSITAILIQFQQHILQIMLSCGCPETDIPNPDEPSSVFDTLAMPSSPTPTQKFVQKRIRQIILKLHPDKSDEAIVAHCEPFGINIQTACDLKEWLCKFEDEEHFEQHWKILGDSGPERKSFPWNPSGNTSETCILAVDHRGKEFFDSRKTSPIPFAPGPRNF
jgi:hypothetical protein